MIKNLGKNSSIKGEACSLRHRVMSPKVAKADLKWEGSSSLSRPNLINSKISNKWLEITCSPAKIRKLKIIQLASADNTNNPLLWVAYLALNSWLTNW